MITMEELVKHYLDVGLTPIRIKYRDKSPAGPWDSNTFTKVNLEELLKEGPWNVGILLGKRSKNLIVFDYESKEALAEHFGVLEEHGLADLLETWVVETGKGVHVYYFIDWKDPHSAELIRPIPLKRFFRDLEVRGEGNYVVAPPSLHPSGVRYQFALGPYLPIRTIGSREFALLLYTYAKTGDITAVKFEELHKFLSNIYPSYHEIDVLPPKPSKDEVPPTFAVSHKVVDDVNVPVIVSRIAPLLAYVPRQEFTLTLASTLARKGVHPAKSAELLAALLDKKIFTARRSESDSNEVGEAKRRVQGWVYAYNNAWRVLHGKTLEQAFPSIKQTFIKTLQEKSSLFGSIIDESWWYVSNSSGDRIRGVPSLVGLIARAIEARERNENHVISEESAREVAWRIVQDILKAIKPERSKVERLARLTRVYRIGTPKVVDVYFSAEKGPSPKYLQLSQRLKDKDPELAKLVESRVEAFREEVIPVIFQNKSGYLTKGVKRIFYFRVNQDVEIRDDRTIPKGVWQSFDIEYVEGAPLTSKPVDVLKAVFYDGGAFLKLYVEGKIIEGTIETVIDTLVKGGVTTAYEKEYLRKYFTWISQTFRGKAYLAPGIYEDRGRFIPVLPTTVDMLLPHSPLTSAFVERLKMWASQVTEEDYERFVEGIVRYKQFLKPHVYYATMGYLGIAGFLGSIIDVTGSIKPALLFLGPQGTGKSHLAKFIAVCAYGSEVWGPSSYRSDFRFDELFSSRTFPLFFDDIHKYGSEKLQDLKSILTGNTLTFRGRGVGSIKLYQLAAVPVFTSNEMVTEFENDAALMDRLIILEITEQLSPKEKAEYREKLDEPVGISRDIVYAHYFVKELVDIVNEIGGKGFLKGAFKRWFKYAVNHNIVDGRDPEKFATLMVGAELIAALLHRHGHEFDLDEAAREIAKIFVEKETSIPQPLYDLISLVDKFGVGITHEEGLILTNKHLVDIRSRVKGDFMLPRRLRDVSILLEGLGYPRSKTLPAKGHYVPELQKKIYGVLIPWEVVDVVIGKPLEGGGVQADWKVMSEIVNVLSMQPATFDEVVSAVPASESEVSAALDKLVEDGIVFVKNGYYMLVKSKAKEAGFDVVETYTG